MTTEYKVGDEIIYDDSALCPADICDHFRARVTKIAPHPKPGASIVYVEVIETLSKSGILRPRGSPYSFASSTTCVTLARDVDDLGPTVDPDVEWPEEKHVMGIDREEIDWTRFKRIRDTL